jgi:hypothetical protein
MQGRSTWLAGCIAPAVGLLALGVAACGDRPTTDAHATGSPDSAAEQDGRSQSEHLPLRIPIAAVMTGAINRSSYDVFQAATSTEDLSENGWLGLGEAAVSLVGAATLITVPGTGPEDVAWTGDPRWRRLSAEMQGASLSIGAAASSRDRTALADATARLAQSCQSCHLVFSSRLLTSPAPDLEGKR